MKPQGFLSQQRLVSSRAEEEGIPEDAPEYAVAKKEAQEDSEKRSAVLRRSESRSRFTNGRALRARTRARILYNPLSFKVFGGCDDVMINVLLGYVSSSEALGDPGLLGEVKRLTADSPS